MSDLSELRSAIQSVRPLTESEATELQDLLKARVLTPPPLPTTPGALVIDRNGDLWGLTDDGDNLPWLCLTDASREWSSGPEPSAIIHDPDNPAPQTIQDVNGNWWALTDNRHGDRPWFLIRGHADTSHPSWWVQDPTTIRKRPTDD